MVIRPGLFFMLSLVVVGPVIAIAGLTAGGLWAPAGLTLASGVVSISAWASFASLRSQADLIPSVLRLRMMGVTATVSLVAGGLAVGSAVRFISDVMS